MGATSRKGVGWTSKGSPLQTSRHAAERKGSTAPEPPLRGSEVGDRCRPRNFSNTLDWNRWMLWEEAKPFA